MEKLAEIVTAFNIEICGARNIHAWCWRYKNDGHKTLGRLDGKDDGIPEPVTRFNDKFAAWEAVSGCTANFKWMLIKGSLELHVTEIVLPIFKDEGPSPESFAEAMEAAKPTEVGYV